MYLLFWSGLWCLEAAEWLERPTRAPIARLGSLQFRHGAEVSSLAYSHDGKWLASGGADHLIHLWDARTGDLVKTLRGHTHAPRQLAFFPDDQRLLSASGDGTVRIWDLAQAREIKRLAEFQPGGDLLLGRPEMSFALSKDGRTGIVAAPIRAIRVWDFTADREIKLLWGHEDHIVALQISPDGKYAASSGAAATVIVWDLSTGEKLATERLHNHQASLGAAFSPDSQAVAISSLTGIKFIDLPSKKPLLPLPRPAGQTIMHSGLRYTHDGKYLIGYAGYQQGLMVFGAQSHAVLRTLKTNVAPQPVWALSPDSRVVAFAAKGGDIQLWDFGRDRVLNAEGHAQPITDLAFSRDGRTLLTAAGATVRSWDAATGKPKARHDFDADAVALCAHAKQPHGALVVCAQGPRLQRWEWSGAEAPRQDKDYEGLGYFRGQIAVSPGGRWLAALGGRPNPELVLWRANEAHAHHGLPHNRPDLRRPVFSPDDRYLLQYSGAHAHLFDFLIGKETDVALGKNYDAIEAAAFSVDSRLLAVVLEPRDPRPPGAGPRPFKSAARSFFCYEIATGQIRLQLPPLPAETLAFSPDGRYLAVASGPDHVIRIVHLASGRRVASFLGHRGKVTRLVFSADGKRLASASADTTALVFDVSFLGAPPPAAVNLAGPEIEALWQDLRLPGGAVVHHAIDRLSADPAIVPVLKARLQPQPRVDPKVLAQYVRDLDDDLFHVREYASQMLPLLIEEAEPLLRNVIATSRSPEAVLRTRRILADSKHLPALRWREVRAVEILERIGTRAAQEVLAALAKDAPTARRTLEAQAALKRLEQTR